MHRLKYFFCFLVISFIFTGCTDKTEKSISEQSNLDQLNAQISDLNQQIETLKGENQTQLTQLDTLKNDNQSLLKKQQESEEILSSLNNEYDSMPAAYSQRLIEEDKDIRALPDSRLEPLRNIGKGTVLEVVASADISDGNSLVRWLFVHTDSGDTPCPNLGWIKEKDTVTFSEENQLLATYPLRIKPDTKDLNNNIGLDDTEIIQNYWLDFYDGDNAQVHGTGGNTHYISRDSILYPEIDNTKSDSPK